MFKRFSFLLAITLWCTLFTGYSAKAQAESFGNIPLKIQGDWALPDCRHYDEALILTQHFYLKSTKGGNSFFPANYAARGKTLELAGKKQGIQLEEDGVLRFLNDKTEYMGCADTPTIIPNIMARFMRYVDRIKAQCTLDVSNDCTRVLFKMTDVNGNGKITADEIKRTFANALLFAELAEKQTLTTKEAITIVKLAKSEGQKISNALMMTQDKNRSKDIDFNELTENTVVPPQPIIREMLLKAGKIFPAFKLAAALLK
jgi:hypothetical protein